MSGEGEDVSELVVYWCECVCEGGASVCVSEHNMVLHKLKKNFSPVQHLWFLAGYNG